MHRGLGTKRVQAEILTGELGTVLVLDPHLGVLLFITKKKYEAEKICVYLFGTYRYCT
jgi:hypothetical protein